MERQQSCLLLIAYLRRMAAYWRTWGVVLCAMFLSFAGLLALGVGFCFTSVWFWQVAAFSFATVFTQRFDLDRGSPAAPASPLTRA